ncbi:transposase, partial [Methylobacterium aquaticum]|uniref:transposase n=1 Tax=Methylobacterium aquaticum TaxID=270351 RepID=UPI003D16EA39
SDKPSYRTTLEYSERWAIEPMFSDFKSRGFGIDNTQLRYPDRLARLLLVMALALYSAVSTGRWDEVHYPTPAEKKI